MQKGTVVSIHLGATGGAPVISVNEAQAIAGKGLDGDRYFKQVGTYSSKPGPDRELTLIEIEAIEALNSAYGIELKPEDSRRNIATRGVPLNHWVGREFRIAGVTLRGIRLCEPCSHLERLSQKGVMRGLVHRGGLRARILTTGTIRVGDTVEEAFVVRTRLTSKTVPSRSRAKAGQSKRRTSATTATLRPRR